MGLLSFTNITISLFLIYVSVAAYEIWHLFHPDLSIPMYAKEINGTTIKVPSEAGVLPPRWSPATTIDIHLALAPHPNRRITLKPSSDVDHLYIQSHVSLNDTHTWNFNLTVPQLTKMAKKVYYLHMYLCRTGYSPYPTPKSASKTSLPIWDDQTLFIPSPLAVMMLPKLNNTRHLLSRSNATAEEIKREDERIAMEKKNRVKSMHLKTKLRWRYVEDESAFPADRIPGDIYRFLTLDDQHRYSPIVYAEDAWLLREDYAPFNTTTPTSEWTPFPLTISYQPISLGMFRFSMQMEQSFKLISSVTGDDDDSESEQIKRLFMDTQPWLLLLTMVVSVVHIIFDTLAFKNDIQYWRNKQSFVGISAKSLIISTVSRTIILLYLIDNDASKLILGSSLVSLIINIWKMLKIMRLSLTSSPPFIHIGLPPEDESRTQQYDDTAMKYLMWAMIPLVVGSSIYSLYYHTHRSWYSWLLSSFATAMYVGGFIMMTPQLFINYKLKSVTHLPWRVFVYKALNTFIDDLFAFIIVMPTMHRLSVFRDDIIFFIYLYQRWIYPVDMTRTHGKPIPVVATTANTATDTAVAAAVESQSEAEMVPTTSTSTLRRIRSAQQAYEAGDAMPHEPQPDIESEESEESEDEVAETPAQGAEPKKER